MVRTAGRLAQKNKPTDFIGRMTFKKPPGISERLFFILVGADPHTAKPASTPYRCLLGLQDVFGKAVLVFANEADIARCIKCR